MINKIILHSILIGSIFLQLQNTISYGESGRFNDLPDPTICDPDYFEATYPNCKKMPDQIKKCQDVFPDISTNGGDGSWESATVDGKKAKTNNLVKLKFCTLPTPLNKLINKFNQLSRTDNNNKPREQYFNPALQLTIKKITINDDIIPYFNKYDNAKYNSDKLNNNLQIFFNNIKPDVLNQFSDDFISSIPKNIKSKLTSKQLAALTMQQLDLIQPEFNKKSLSPFGYQRLNYGDCAVDQKIAINSNTYQDLIEVIRYCNNTTNCFGFSVNPNTKMFYLKPIQYCEEAKVSQIDISTGYQFIGKISTSDYDKPIISDDILNSFGYQIKSLGDCIDGKTIDQGKFNNRDLTDVIGACDNNYKCKGLALNFSTNEYHLKDQDHCLTAERSPNGFQFISKCEHKDCS